MKKLIYRENIIYFIIIKVKILVFAIIVHIGIVLQVWIFSQMVGRWVLIVFFKLEIDKMKYKNNKMHIFYCWQQIFLYKFKNKYVAVPTKIK